MTPEDRDWLIELDRVIHFLPSFREKERIQRLGYGLGLYPLDSGPGTLVQRSPTISELRAEAERERGEV